MEAGSEEHQASLLNAELEAEAEAKHYVERSTGPHSSASRDRRHLFATKHSVSEYHDIFHKVAALRHAMAEIVIKDPSFEDGNSKLLYETYKQKHDDLYGKLFELRYVPAPKEMPRRHRDPKFTTVRHGLQSLHQDYAAFADMFLFEPHEVEVMAKALFPEQKIKVKNRGTYSAEEVFLVVLARLRMCLRTLATMSVVFDREPGVLGEMFHVGLEILAEKWGHLLEPEVSLEKQKDMVPKFKQAMKDKFQKLRHNAKAPFPKRFRGGEDKSAVGAVAVVIPYIVQGTTTNPETGATVHNKAHQVDATLVVLPNGLVGAVSFEPPEEGALLDKLKQANLPVLCTANTLPETPFSCPLPKDAKSTPHLTAQDAAPLGKIRDFVEREAGFIKEDFHALTHLDKHEMASTDPFQVLKLGPLLENFRSCLRGDKVGKYFGLESPSFEDYIRQ